MGDDCRLFRPQVPFPSSPLRLRDYEVSTGCEERMVDRAFNSRYYVNLLEGQTGVKCRFCEPSSCDTASPLNRHDSGLSCGRLGC
jgi:hypothetical protein